MKGESAEVGNDVEFSAGYIANNGMTVTERWSAIAINVSFERAIALSCCF